MSLIVLEHASLSFGAQRILTDASLRIGEKERIGLVGPNGAGKSTLLKVLMGELALDGGNLIHARGLAIGYLPQDVQELAGGTVLGSVLATVPGRLQTQARLAQTEQELTSSEDEEEQLRLAGLLGELADLLEHYETYYGEPRARSILLGLGFRPDELLRPLAELSGGWKMRCALAGLLFRQPDVLFLDEPTNHLDLPSVLWLDRFLDGLSSAVVLISHDRAFLNRHVARVLSFEPEGLRSYTGDYQSYLVQRDLEEEVRSRSLENRERVLERTERFVERFRAKATKARQAQARARRVKRMLAELEADRPATRRKALSFSFPPIPPSGRDVLLLEGVSKGFGATPLFRELTRGVYRGERIVVVGRNGAGKTTLLRLMAGDLLPDGGRIRRGAGVRIGYYAQHMSDGLDFSRTVVEEVRAASPSASESYVRGVCGAFLFSGDDVDKTVGVLSGGERARVQLARLLVDPGNLLLMDEPTNHLDVQAADALAEALDGYDGTLVFVSHDLGFVDRLATKVWDLEHGELEEFPGRLHEYLELRARREAEAAGPPAGPTAGKGAPTGKGATVGKGAPETKHHPAAPRAPVAPTSRSEPPVAAQAARPDAPPTSPPQPAPREQEHEGRRAREEATRRQLEERIAKLTVQQKELESQLAAPELYLDQARFHPLLRQYQDIQTKVTELQARLDRARRERR